MPRAHAAVPVAVLVAALSLLVHRALAFDAEAWVVWGREAWSLSIDMGAGPSWKPLTVLMTAVLGGDPWLWLLVARASALIAMAGVARLVWARAGGVAAAAAVALLAFSPWWLLHAAVGNSEPLLVALVAWAAVAHDDGRFRWAFGLACAAALLRPEVWPFLALYGLWLMRERHLPVRAVVGAGAGVLALWVVPELLGSGVGSSTRRARAPGSPGSASSADVPFLEVWRDAAEMLTPALLVAVPFLRRTDRVWLAAGAAWILIVAVMAQAGFAGNPRYLIPGLVALLASAAVAFRPPVLGAAVAVGVLAFNVGDFERVGDELALRARLRENLEALPVPERCRPVRTARDHRTIAARVFDQTIPQYDPQSELVLVGERWILRC